MDQFDIYYRAAVMVLEEVSNLHLQPYFQWEYLFLLMWGAHRSFTAVLVKQLLFICDHVSIQHCTSFSILVISRVCFFFLFLLFWLKACTTFFLNYVSLSCDCYFWQFNSLWTGKLWNDCPLSFGINQLPGFKLIWQKL